MRALWSRFLAGAEHAKAAGRLALVMAASAVLLGQTRAADVTIYYHEYSSSPTIGRGAGTSTDPRSPGYGAMRLFIETVEDYTDALGADALPPGQQVHFRPDARTGREWSALRAGIQFARRDEGSAPVVAEPSWGFVYNALPFGMRFEQMLGFLYDARLEGAGGNGIELAQTLLDRGGGTQIVLPVVGSTMQGSGYFPQPIGAPVCAADDPECRSHGAGIGLAGLCSSGWRIRYLAPSQDIIDRACDRLVQRGAIPAKMLTFYPPVGGQSVLLPLQRGAIQGLEYVNPQDDLVDFFPVKEATAATPQGNPDVGALDCGPAVPFPMPAGTVSHCSQNIGQLGARYLHHPSWHQPFLISWMHIDKRVWNGLTEAQRTAIRRAARDSVRRSYAATESVQCDMLKTLLDINRGIAQRNRDGSIRRIGGRPVSAAVTIASWPDDALQALRDARDEYFAVLSGSGRDGKTDSQEQFAVVLDALTRYATGLGATAFDPGTFPASTGLVPDAACTLID